MCSYIPADNKTNSYKDDLMQRLKANPEYAAEYIFACLQASYVAFELAVKDVIEAQTHE